MNKTLIRNFRPEDRDWLVETHRDCYATENGFDDSFAELVGKIIDGFIASHDVAREAGWIAESEGRRLGSIFCTKLSRETAQLRLFLLTPEARGTGLAGRMLKTCMQFAEAQGYSGICLWTHESHQAACKLYRGHGWKLCTSEPTRSFGQDLVEQRWGYLF